MKNKVVRRQSLRPRQIDVNSKMIIIRSEADLNMIEDTGTGQKITSLEQLQTIMEDTIVKPKRKKQIIIPENMLVPEYDKDVPATYQIPTNYVRFQNLTEEDDAKIEVDLEIQDMEWLRTHPKYGENGDPRYQLSLELFNRMIDLLEKGSGQIAPNLITLSEAENIFQRSLSICKIMRNKVIADVYQYWVQRRNDLKKPLLRRFWPQTPLNDTNPHLVFRPREKERYKLRKHRKNDLENFRRMQVLREDFDRTREMLLLIERRERCKRLLLDYLDEIREQTIFELTHPKTDPSKRNTNANLAQQYHEMMWKKGKTKKVKKRKDSVDLTTNHPLPSTSLSSTSGQTTIVPLKLPSFMEVDTSHYSIQSSFKSPEPPHFPTFPSFGDTQRHPRLFIGPPKYKCRRRLGRGGRILIDRIPLKPEYSDVKREESAHPSIYDIEISSTIPSPEDTAVVAPESETFPVPVASPSETPTRIDSSRIEEVLAMSDSEDEILDPYVLRGMVKTEKPIITRPIKYSTLV